MSPNFYAYKIKSQSGFLIPLALILIVGIAFLAIAISRLSGQTGSHVTVEGLTVQAFYAAESGGQYGISRLFDSATTRALTDANCTAIASVPFSFSVAGLTSCSVTVSCRREIDAGDTTSFYYINSVAQCGAGQLLGEREVEISAFMQ